MAKFLLFISLFCSTGVLATESLSSYKRYEYTCKAKYSFNRWKSFNYSVKTQVNIYEDGHFEFYKQPRLNVFRQHYSTRRTLIRNRSVRYDGFRDSLHWFSYPQSRYGLNFAFNARKSAISFNHRVERYGKFLRSHGSCKRKFLGRY